MEKLKLKNIPNSWGHQVYNRSYRKFLRDHQLDLNNHLFERGFLEKFVSKHLSKAKLKNRLNKMIP
jgi:hypothetical protein